jgi:hypothetical protein
MNLSIKELNELIYSLGITASKGIFVNKELNASLIDKLYSELNSKIAIQSDITDEVIDRIKSHYVSNEEADEDAKQRDYSAFSDYASTLQQDSDRYESSVEKDYDNHLAKLKERGYITQTLLDYVDRRGAVCYSELQAYYKIITGGSNSFSHILANLRIPYKNRKTQRYIAKEGKRYSDAKYVIKVANPSNWVEVDY